MVILLWSLRKIHWGTSVTVPAVARDVCPLLEYLSLQRTCGICCHVFTHGTWQELEIVMRLSDTHAVSFSEPDLILILPFASLHVAWLCHHFVSWDTTSLWNQFGGICHSNYLLVLCTHILGKTWGTQVILKIVLKVTMFLMQHRR